MFLEIIFNILCVAFVIWHRQMVKTRRMLAYIAHKVRKNEKELKKTRESISKYQTARSNLDATTADYDTLKSEITHLEKSIVGLEYLVGQNRPRFTPIIRRTKTPNQSTTV